MLIYKIQFQNGAHLMLIDWGKKKVGEGGGEGNGQALYLE